MSRCRKGQSRGLFLADVTHLPAGLTQQVEERDHARGVVIEVVRLVVV